jgi:hypothetical protein
VNVVLYKHMNDSQVDIIAPNKVTFGRPQKFDDPIAFREQLEEYFEKCQTTDLLPTITGLAVHLGTDRKTLYNYKSKDTFSPLIKEALTRCENTIEQLALQGKLNPAMSIFSLKNNYGWVDKTEVDNKHEVVAPILGGKAKEVTDD